MSIPISSRNLALNGLSVMSLSLHSAWPGVNGTNELSGGGYARQVVTLAAASGGQRITTTTATFTAPASPLVYVGMWNASLFVGAMPIGGATPRNFSAILSTDQIVSTGHGFADTTPICFINGTPCGGTTEGAVYYVRDSTADAFKVAATSGGVAINISSGASFACVVSQIAPQTTTAGQMIQVPTITAAIPD